VQEQANQQVPSDESYLKVATSSQYSAQSNNNGGTFAQSTISSAKD
jgi:hypothetical protein